MLCHLNDPVLAGKGGSCVGHWPLVSPLRCQPSFSAPLLSHRSYMKERPECHLELPGASITGSKK